MNWKRRPRWIRSSPWPVETYRELCILDDRGFGLPEDVQELEEEFSPGYHKGEVTQAFDTLRFPLPGVYRYEWNEDGRGGGGCIWWDEESDSPLWRVSGYRSKNVKAEWNADLTGFSDVETREEPGLQRPLGLEGAGAENGPGEAHVPGAGRGGGGSHPVCLYRDLLPAGGAGEHLCPDPPDRGGGERGGVTVEKRWIHAAVCQLGAESPNPGENLDRAEALVREAGPGDA